MEPLWRKVAAPLIVATILGVASVFIGIFKLAFTSIEDPYAGNIYWETCLKQGFSQTGRFFFDAYCIVNESCKPTETPVKFDFEIYKPADTRLLLTSLSQRNHGNRTMPDLPQDKSKIIVISSSEIETEFEVYTDYVTLWNVDQTSEGWHRIIATLPTGIPANDNIDIAMIYWSYSPIRKIRIGTNPLIINDIPYPDAASNKKAIAQRRQIIANQRSTLVLYWLLFSILLTLTFLAGFWIVSIFYKLRSKLRYQKEKLEENRRKEEEKQRALNALYAGDSSLEAEFRLFLSQREEEIKMDEEFEMPKEDEEAMDGGNQKSPQNQAARKPIKTTKKKKKKKKTKKKKH